MIVRLIAVAVFVGVIAYSASLLAGASFWASTGIYAVSGLAVMAALLMTGLISDYLGAFARAEREDAKHTAEPGLFLSQKTSQRAPRKTARVLKKDMNVLLVDDDDISLQILKDMLEAIGYTKITTCLSAFDAETIIADAPTQFDCLFLDIQMPDYDGIALAAKIRQQDGYQETPIIMVTAMTDRANISQAFSAGADDYVTKPFALNDLKARIKSAEIAFQQSVRVCDLHTVDPVQLSAGRWRTDVPQPERAVGSVITQAALENYLLQIERGGLFATNFMGVKIDGYEQLSATKKSQEVRRMLAEVSNALLMGLNDRNAFVAYVGEGVFACVVNGQAVIERTRLSTLTNAKLVSAGFSSATDVTLTYSNARHYVVTQSEPAILEALYNIVADVKYPTTIGDQLFGDDRLNLVG